MSDNSEVTAESLLAEAKKAIDSDQFPTAWALLEKAKMLSRDDALGVRIEQKQVVATYKDEERTFDDRMNAALKQLRAAPLNLEETQDPETLGLAGAVYKRIYLSAMRLRDLETSYNYYHKGHQLRVDSDNGFTGINAAFMLDLKANHADITAEAAVQFRREAESIRQDIIATFLEKAEKSADWWLMATLAEAYFGIGDYEQAKPWLLKAIRLAEIPKWKLATTFNQLARVALLREPETVDIEKSEAWLVLLEAAKELKFDASALETTFSGKVGLALSGGGFRASLYHIGVLARLAEQDMLRRVEVISCVSGGSILGAAYYLEVRHLLQSKADQDIGRQDYIDIVQRLSTHFLTGVQRNLRVHLTSNLWKNWRMAWGVNYTRTSRLAELYEKELFSRIEDSEGKSPRYLSGLFIHPLTPDGTKDDKFRPKDHNWQRKAKVPILILNATTLNTGHNWQFTAAWMGEPASGIEKIDANYLLKRVYYANNNQQVRLGMAVAASSCVPAMFNPIVIKNLYPGKTVKLVDGGVHDNQGICGLMDQDCSVLLVSDASGQMIEENRPKAGTLQVYRRTSDMLMERVRNGQHLYLRNRLEAGLLRGLMFIHLKLELASDALDAINAQLPDVIPTVPPESTTLTTYDIRKDLQRGLAGIRTDLDAFHDAEAYALMTSGYQMTKLKFKSEIQGFAISSAPDVAWDFLKAAEPLKSLQNSSLPLVFKVSNKLFFKTWRFSTWLRMTLGTLAGLVGVTLVFCLCYTFWHQSLQFPLRWGLIAVLLTLFQILLFVFKCRYNVMVRSLKFIGLTLGWLATWLHLGLFNKLYLRRGKRF